MIQQKSEMKTVANILELAKIAESAGLGNEDDLADDSRMNQLKNEVRAGREEVQQLTTEVVRMSVSLAQPRSPTPECHQTRVSFQVPSSHARMQRAGGLWTSTLFQRWMWFPRSITWLQFQCKPSVLSAKFRYADFVL